LIFLLFSKSVIKICSGKNRIKLSPALENLHTDTVRDFQKRLFYQRQTGQFSQEIPEFGYETAFSGQYWRLAGKGR